MLRRPRIFLSSTFRDLHFERRFVAGQLVRMGFEVIRMEDHLHNSDFNWERWSTNRAGECEVYLRIYDKRIGSLDNYFLPQHPQSFVRLEEEYSRSSRMLSVQYELKRPFPDEALLFADEERDEYYKTLQEKDLSPRTTAAQEAMQWEAAFFALSPGVPIYSVDQLSRHLQTDLTIRPSQLLRYRLGLWRRYYLDNTSTAWRHASADESYVASTSRTGLSRRLRAPVLACLALWLVSTFTALPLKAALLASFCLFCLGALLIAAYAPTFVWKGTRTVIARGAFSVRVLQCPLDAAFVLAPRWVLLERWCGFGALAITFPDGRRLFVPLVNDPTTFAHDVYAERSLLNKRS